VRLCRSGELGTASGRRKGVRWLDVVMTSADGDNCTRVSDISEIVCLLRVNNIRHLCAFVGFVTISN
jgi:hypothetical protein